jgi:hypothetical protein
MTPSTAAVPLVDDFLPDFDIESRHQIDVAAPAGVVYQEARRLDISSSWTIRVLFRLRGLPTSALKAEGLSRIRFKLLAEDPPVGFALGIVGQFWTPTGTLLDFDPSEFRLFDRPGFAKAIWSFDTQPKSSTSTSLRTVTRVACTDPASRRSFGRYWTLVGPLSGLIRARVLRLMKESAEERPVEIPTRGPSSS